MYTIIAIVAAYLIGSISCAVLICKFANLPDPRTQGSKNPGASNVLRTAGSFYAVLTLFGDALKGWVAILVGLTLGVHDFTLGIVGLAAVLGHMYPLYFKFKGGKGMATSFGVYFGLSFVLGIVAAVAWGVVALLSRYASLASLAACILAPFVVLFAPHGADYTPGLALIALAIIWRHQENIDRLRKGKETKLSAKK
jgi:acyl phosphate:glycerol-3-phosphate acyltransferase